MSCKGRILFGINRIYTVEREDKELFECRIKGKVLAQEEKSYNPLAPGDIVSFELDAHHPGKGMILEKEDRTNAFSRYNTKRKTPQILAANFDCIVCVASPVSPPFRPRFIDRVAVSVPVGTPVVIVLNKADQGIYPEDEARFAHYKKLGYQLFTCSATTGRGVKRLAKYLKGKTAVFVGQSGVGKSSLINVLRPDLEQRVGEVCEKHNRGRHTTNFAALFPEDNGLEIVDTPGVRELEVYGIEPEDLGHYFPDFQEYLKHCKFSRCLHQNEPDCAIKNAVEKGNILVDRYTSYTGILQDLIERRNFNEHR